MSVRSATCLPCDGASVPLGTALLPGTGVGVDIAAAGYREDEFLVRGAATQWTYDADRRAAELRTGVEYTTRVLVRTPVDAGRFNGVVQAEPLHPEYDTAPSWRVLHPWIMRTGAAWLGVTHEPRMAESMRADFDPSRYAALSIPAPSLRFDIVADVIEAVRERLRPLWRDDLRPAERAYLSGWSMTGSFCRVYLGEGFHERRRRPRGAPLVDGYVIAISSGGATRAGYPGIDGDATPVPPGDPRRTVAGRDVPVIELLSELESETHLLVSRPDGDQPGDRYRLYQVAGTSHNTTGRPGTLTNREQYRRRGATVGRDQIVEPRSRARMDLIARAVFASLDRWVRDGTAPPRADRFAFDPDAPPGPHDSRPLRRDRFGNAVGGIRTPWVEVPVARYRPHSTPVPEGCRPSPWMPMTDPHAIAWMIGNAVPLEAADLAALYSSPEDYLTRYAASCAALCRQGFLLWEDMETLMAEAQRNVTAIEAAGPPSRPAEPASANQRNT